MSPFVAVLALAGGLVVPAANAPAPAPAAGPAIGHMVFFTLKDATPENRAKMIAACEKYLTDHDGVLYFSAGVRGEQFKREVNAVDWDIALHVVFDGKASYDKYEVHPRHVKFIDENRDLWAKVRVFDSELKTPKSTAKSRQ